MPAVQSEGSHCDTHTQPARRLNALGGTLREDLYAAIIAAGADPDVGVIVITGAGRGFCSGGDVKSMSEKEQAGQAASADERLAPVRDRCILAMRDVRNRSSRRSMARRRAPA